MTDPTDTARIEMTPARSAVTQAETDRWFKTPAVAILAHDVDLKQCSAAFRPKGWPFDPAKPISPLAARLLVASNGLHSHAVDGTPASEPHSTRHAGYIYRKETT